MTLKFLACTVRSCDPHFTDSLLEHWYEYEAGETRAAILARQINNLECMDQAMIYEERLGLDLSEFISLKEQITLPELQPWLNVRLRDYELLKLRKKANLVVVFISGILCCVPLFHQS